MGWLRRAKATPASTAPEPTVTALVGLATSLRGSAVSRSLAVQVPSVARAVSLIKGTIAGMPLRQYRVDLVTGAEVRIDARAWLDDPARYLTRQELVAATIDDLMFHGVAYWEKTPGMVDPDTGRPREVFRLPAAGVSPDLTMVDESRPDGRQVPIRYEGRLVPANRYIRFDSPFDPIIVTGYVAISTALSLIEAVKRGAEAPAPSIILKNTGADIPADQVKNLVDAWKAARQDGAVGYLSSVLDVVQTGYSNRDQELVAALNQSTLEIARLFNLDAWWLSGSVTGSSLTYQNRVDAMRALVELACGPWMDVIGERLSKDDVTPHGNRIRFDATDLLRDNPAQASQILATLHPTGLLSLGEARDLIGLPTYRKGRPWTSAPSPSSSAPQSTTSTPAPPASPASPSPTGSAPASATA